MWGCNGNDQNQVGLRTFDAPQGVVPDATSLASTTTPSLFSLGAETAIPHGELISGTGRCLRSKTSLQLCNGCCRHIPHSLYLLPLLLLLWPPLPILLVQLFAVAALWWCL